MTLNFRRASIPWILALACMQTYAQPAPETTAPPAAVELAPAPAEPVAATVRLEPRQVPALRIRWMCDTCEANPKVAPLIQQSYAEEAARQGYAVSPSETAEVVINDFRQRPPGVRATMGIFAGKDRLGVQIAFRDQKRKASDYSANAWYGMNSLCEAVGKQSFAQVVGILQAP